MNVKDFLEENFTAKKIRDFERSYKKKYTKQAYSQFLRISLERFNTYRWQLLADHFTNGDLEKIFTMYCKQKKESIYPKQIDTKNL